MSNLISNYEISVWDDIFQAESQSFVEQRRIVIGAPDLFTQGRAINAQFKRGVNGTNELSFDMYYKYVDTITGEEVDNPFVQNLANETKLKLKHKNKWYDFIIKDIQEDSVNKLFKYRAIDQHVNELSKNGFGLTLDTQLENNIGTVSELGHAIFDGTGWDVDSEAIPQKMEENLIKISFSYNSDIVLKDAVQLLDSGSISPQESAAQDLTIPKNGTIYVFYSTLKNENEKGRFQFIYIDPEQEILKNQDRLIQNKDCQYYIDDVTYSNPTDSGGQGDLAKYSLKFPSIFDGLVFEATISDEYRGERYVFSHKQLYNQVLDRYVAEYKDSSGNTWHEFTDTKIEAPVLIQNLITNTTFKSTSGWTGQYLTSLVDGEPLLPNKNGENGATRDVATSPDILTALINGSYSENLVYTPYIHLNFRKRESIVINSGSYDNKKIIDNFTPGQKFVLMWQCITENGQGIDARDLLENLNIELAQYDYNVSGNCYLTDNKNLLLNFSPGINTVYTCNINKGNTEETYCYTIATISENYNLSKQEFLSKKFQLFFSVKERAQIDFEGGESLVVNFKDLVLIPYIHSENFEDKTFITPFDQPTEAISTTTYSYFNPNLEDNKDATSQNDMIIFHYPSQKEGLTPNYVTGAEKMVTLSVKQSNYFNAAQSLAETAQCWVEFDVIHDSEGNITEKWVRFKNYIGKDNYAGFRYGVNLKSIQRQLDSKAIVSKLIVPEVINKYAKNGFCSIQRAGSNETGENYIYDFSHYVRQKQLDYNMLWNVLYNLEGAKGKDIDKTAEETNLNGYYFRLQDLNKQISDLNDSKIVYSSALTQAKANLQIATNGKTKSAEEHEAAAIDFYDIAGYEYTSINEAKKAEIEKSDELLKAFTKVATYETSYKNFVIQEEEAQADVNEYTKGIEEYDKEIKALKEYKTTLVNLFESTYRRFIQEGTWNKQESIDDEKYFLEAKSVAYTSAQPQVNYSISVLSLEGIKGYENFDFELADKAWMEDEEYFGYDEEGNPYREEVVLTEINYILDEPDKTTIKVQNFKNQFQDLFQRITASVQTVNYSSGAWNSASSFVQSDTQTQAEFITNALNNADSTLQNAGEQSVVIDKEGITVTDLSSPDQKIRMVGGAIMLGKTDENGQYKWDIGMTSEGINARQITTGSLNTGLITIYNGEQPTFRWDARGITAFDFSSRKTADGQIVDYNFNPNKGVRFDKFGICGFDGVNGQQWSPTSLDDIRKNANFALTWDGLFLKLGNGKYDVSGEEIWHSSQCLLGKTDGILYNGWDDDDPWKPTNAKEGNYFVKVFSAGIGNNEDYQENLAIFDDGTLLAKSARISGCILADSGSIGGWDVSQKAITKGTLTLHADDENLKESLIPSAGQSAIRISCGQYTNPGPYERIFKYSDCIRIRYDSYVSNLTLEVTGTSGVTKNTSVTIVDPYGLLYDPVIREDGDRLFVDISCEFADDEWATNPDNLFSLSFDCSYEDNYFQLLNDGSLYASAAKIGDGVIGSDGSLFLNTYDMKGIINGYEQDNWRLTLGSNFGVTSDGSLYASQGKIAGWSFDNTSIYGEATYNGEKYYWGLKSSDNKNSNPDYAIAFFAGSTDSSGNNPSFYVSNGGRLYIQGWTISKSGIKTDIYKWNETVNGIVTQWEQITTLTKEGIEVTLASYDSRGNSLNTYTQTVLWWQLVGMNLANLINS